MDFILKTIQVDNGYEFVNDEGRMIEKRIWEGGEEVFGGIWLRRIRLYSLR